jgi:hypothetical protein
MKGIGEWELILGPEGLISMEGSGDGELVMGPGGSISGE